MDPIGIGRFDVEVQASNLARMDLQDFTITVSEPPTLTPTVTSTPTPTPSQAGTPHPTPTFTPTPRNTTRPTGEPSPTKTLFCWEYEIFIPLTIQ